jgi:hypothetical protein
MNAFSSISPAIWLSHAIQVGKGSEIQLGAAAIYEAREWMEATLDDGSVGYVLGPNARGHTTPSAQFPAPLKTKNDAEVCPECHTSRDVFGCCVCNYCNWCGGKLEPHSSGVCSDCASKHTYWNDSFYR